ncbi:MAG: hypothetical protein MJZ84_08930 [Paludibacteraceae bacterium]|nr:hypothetical protein [Paludibacteraceae bacterium]
MVKKLGYLILVLAVSFSIIGCTGKKAADITPEQRENFESLAKVSVWFEVFERYGMEPVVTVSDINDVKVYKDQYSVYTRYTFNASGNYTVQDDSGVIYSGTFNLGGYSEGHGGGCETVEITPPQNGSDTLHELSNEETSDTNYETSAKTETPDIYGSLYDYIDENVTLMGTVVAPPVECDINKDGYPELCTTVVTGSGTVSSLIVVYDVYNDQGYMLNDRTVYDYRILGNTADVIAIERTIYGENKKSYGTLVIQDGELIFVEKVEYGATVPAASFGT